MFHTDTYFKQAELKMHTNKHTHRGSSCFGWADCPCSCGLQKIPPDIYCSCLVKLNVFGLMSFIYSNWPMALHWFPVSHGEPERQSAHVLCNLWGDYTTRQPTQHTVFVNACIWVCLLCQFMDSCQCKLFFISESDWHLFYWIMRADVHLLEVYRSVWGHSGNVCERFVCL